METKFLTKLREAKEQRREKLEQQKKEKISKRDMELLKAAYRATGERPYDKRGHVKQAVKREQLLFYSGAKYADEHPAVATKVAYMLLGAGATFLGIAVGTIVAMEGWL